MVLAAMNWFDRQKPVRNSRTIIRGIGVSAENSAGMAVRAALRITNRIRVMARCPRN
jgi:hypothetical protein